MEGKLQCIWTGILSPLPLRICGVATIGIINHLITPVTTIKYRLALVSDDGEEIVPCSSCVKAHISSSITFYRLHMFLTTTEHPDIAYDLLVRCNGVEGHRSEIASRIFLEIIS
jgi:hypothetical protein